MAVEGAELSLSSWGLWAPVSSPVQDCKNVRGVNTGDWGPINLRQGTFSWLENESYMSKGKDVTVHTTKAHVG
jgi:hypothetical protein